MVSDVADLSLGTAEIRRGTLDALVTGDATSPRVLVEKQLAGPLHDALDSLVKLQAVAAELRGAGLDPNAVQAQANRASIRVDALVPTPHSTTPVQQPVLGFVDGAPALHLSLRPPCVSLRSWLRSTS